MGILGILDTEGFILKSEGFLVFRVHTAQEARAMHEASKNQQIL